MVLVVGVVGCTGSGKSTLCEALEVATPSCTIHCDAFFLPDADQPPLDLSCLNWPGGVVPEAFRKKRGDTNVPESVDWAAVTRSVREAVAQCEAAAQERTIFVEGHMIPSAGDDMAELLDAVVCLDVDGQSDVLMERKYARAHLGKQSYQDRGVTREEYRVYWNEYVLARFGQYGLIGPVDVGGGDSSSWACSSSLSCIPLERRVHVSVGTSVGIAVETIVTRLGLTRR